jgi:protein-S-isoprenylcysteine O-methyltransferase
MRSVEMAPCDPDVALIAFELSMLKEISTLGAMPLPDPMILGAVYGLSEVFLVMTRRSGESTVSRDRHSLALLWTIILISLWLGIFMPRLYPNAALPHPHGFYLIGLLLFVGGIVLRWYSIFYLGRLFTVDVAIASEHQVIDSGPYRFIRHPSYTGALIAFVGFGLCLGNWLSLLLITLPISAAFLWRIRVEERALLEALGDNYRAYMSRTKRLLPFVY